MRALARRVWQIPQHQVLAEVYGEATQYLEEEDSIPGVIKIDHGVTASRTLWPSWPDDVSLRSFERIRCDVAVEVAEEAV